MTSINNALSSIISGNKDFCCLCLDSLQEDPIRLNDEVVVNLNNYEWETSIAEVLNSIFNNEVYTYISTFDSLCDQCAKSAISCYKFIQASQKNAEYLTNVFDGIANNFEYTPDELFDSKSLYVSLNLDDFTSKQYYDMTTTTKTPQAVLQRFCTLDNTEKIKVENTIIQKIKKEKKCVNNKVKTKRTKNRINIPNSEMLYDKNNPDLPKCRECLKLYPTIWNLRNHYIRVHAPKVFKCTKCPRKYGSAAFLEAHFNESHCTVVCSECGKTFYNKHTLKVHEMGHHLTLVCQDCGRVYKNKATFKKHIDFNVCGQETRAHPSEAKYTCDYCNKKYTQKVSLRVHIQYEHGNYKAHVCEWCGKKFWAQSRLKAHSVKHTREKNFTCSICDGKFVSKESLLYHTRTHTGEKPHKCPHCEYRFISASRRSDHVKRHHLGGTLECEVCHSKFNSMSFLLKHKKSHANSEAKVNLTNKNFKTIKEPISKESIVQMKSVPKTKDKVFWEISKMEEDIPNFQKIIDSSEVDLHQFTQQAYGDEDTQQSSEEGKVYLEVSDDADDYMKILGV